MACRLASRGSTALKRVALLACLAGAPGCWAVVAGAGAAAGVLYVKGALVVSLDETPRDVLHAAEEAVASMGLVLVSSHASDLDGELIARTATDTRIQVTVRSRTRRTCELTIRVGLFGDEGMSQRLLDRIREQL